MESDNVTDMAHEIRLLKFRLKQANKVMGAQGETIHQLRCELAEVRDLNSKIERGDLRRSERALTVLRELLTKERAERIELGAQLQAIREKEPV